MKKPVVITSIACITSLADDPILLWEKLNENNVGISKLEEFDSRRYPCTFGGVIHDFNFRDVNVQGKNIMNRTNQLEFYSVMKAFQNSNFSQEALENCNLYLGNHIINIDIETMEIMIKLCKERDSINFSKLGNNLRRMPPLNGVKLLPTTPSHFIAKENNLHGKGDVVYSSEISGIMSLLLAYKEIQNNNIEMAVVSSAYSPFTPHEFLWLCDQGLIRSTSEDDDFKELIFPFDKRHNGIIYSEGSAAMILESEESAKKNNRKILAYVEGGSANIFAGETFYSLTERGFSKSIEITLEDSHLDKENIDLIFSNASSNRDWDNTELKAIINTWDKNQVLISNSKANLGYMGPTSGLLDCVLATVSMHKNEYLPIFNFKKDEPTFMDKGKHYINYKPTKKLNRSLVLNAGIGGSYSSVCLKSGEDFYER